MHLDFIKTPFTNNPSMQKYSGDLINKLPRSNYIEEKINQISLRESELCGETELFQNLQLLDKVSTLLEIEKFNAYNFCKKIKNFTHSHITPDHARAIMLTKTFKNLNLVFKLDRYVAKITKVSTYMRSRVRLYRPYKRPR